MERHHNWTGGAARTSRAGTFELLARDGSGRRLGEWPRSGPEELAEALAGLGAARREPAMGGLPRGLLQRLGRGACPGLAERLGLSATELEAFAGPGGRGLFGVGLEPAPPGPMGSPVVFAAGRWMLPEPLTLRVAALLAAGRSVLLLGAKQLPMAADAALGALAEHAGPRLALLHGLDEAGWRALGALARGPEPPAFAGGADRDLRADLEGSLATEPGLAGVLDQLDEPLEIRRALWEFALPRGRRLVGLGRRALMREVEPLAVALVEAAFGRSSALGGLAPLVPHVLTVPASIYSAFTERVRLAIDELGAREAPLAAPGGARQEQRYTAAWRAALDAGAVLLTGGERLVSPAGPALAPALLVNVPPDCKAAEPGEPLAQLRLIRASNRP